MWAGSQTRKRSGSWLVEVDSKRALLFVFSSEVLSLALNLRACRLAYLKSLAFGKLPSSFLGFVLEF